MEKEFTEWFKANEKRFAHGQFDEKQIAYSAWLEGQNQALRIHDVVGRSEQLPTNDDVINAVKKQLNDNGYRTE